MRGGYGLFYDRIPLRALANALLSGGNTTTVGPNSQLSLSLSPTQTGAPVFPNILTSTPAGVLANFSTMNPHMQNAYSEQGSLEIEQQLGAGATVSVGYQHLRGLHLIVSVNQNVPTCTASGANNGCRPNPNIANNSQYSSLADSHYDGLHVSFVQRPTRWASYRISYTWSKSLDDVGEFFFSAPIDNCNIWQDYGRSDDDQRHRVVFDGALHSHGFELSGYAAVLLRLAAEYYVGRHHDTGDRRAADRERGFHRPQCGHGQRFLQPEHAHQPHLRAQRALAHGSDGGILQRAESPQQPDIERSLRRRRVPGGAFGHVRAGDRGQRSQKRPTGPAVQVLAFCGPRRCYSEVWKLQRSEGAASGAWKRCTTKWKA